MIPILTRLGNLWKTSAVSFFTIKEFFVTAVFKTNEGAQKLSKVPVNYLNTYWTEPFVIKWFWSIDSVVHVFCSMPILHQALIHKRS